MAQKDDPVTVVVAWFAQNKRDLPWREPDVTAWGILVSEFMLQQTQVDRALPKWLAWMDTWPTPDALAKAPLSDVLRAWQGLGYPRRAMRLHASAQRIVSEFNGVVPSTQSDLLSLPGVGHYTAAAVAAFAFDQPAVVLDTNIRRVIVRAWSAQALPTAHLTQNEVTLASNLVRDHDGAQWSAAVMELGALICTARAPKCERCPIQTSCAWFAAGQPDNAPARRKQPAFEGSDRQARGALLRAVSASHLATASAIEAAWADELQREKAMTSLIKDGLVIRVDQGYCLPVN